MNLPSGRRTALAIETLQIRVAARPGQLEDWPRTDRIGKARCHVFQCADVLEIWHETIGEATKARGVHVSVHDAAGEPVLLLPLVIERRNGARLLGFPDGSVADYCQPVLFPASALLDQPAMLALWARIRAALPPFDIALLDKMPPTVGDLPNPLMHLGTQRLPESGHVMNLAEGREAVEKQLPVAKRHLRYLRELSRETSVVLEVADNPETAATFLDAMIENKTRRFAETRVPGFELPGKLAFYQEATRRLPLLAAVDLSAVKAGETVLASHWGLVFGQRFYFLMTAYADGKWRKFSPGRILNDELIRWCAANGYRAFDFGIGDEAYKDEYCDEIVPLHLAELPVTWRGRLFLRRGAGLAWLRATPLWQKLRPYKWVVLRALRR